eukprot:5311861-Prymnesium_polylepis.1
MLVAKSTRPSTRLWRAAPLGAPASLSAAAARISDGVAGGVKAARAKSKLGKIEADTGMCHSGSHCLRERLV